MNYYSLYVLVGCLQLQVSMHSAQSQELIEQLTEEPSIVKADEVKEWERGCNYTVFKLTQSLPAAAASAVKVDKEVEQYTQQTEDVLKKLGIPGELLIQLNSSHGELPRQHLIVVATDPTPDRVVFPMPANGTLYCIQWKDKWMLYPKGYPKSENRKATIYESEEGVVKFQVEDHFLGVKPPFYPRKIQWDQQGVVSIVTPGSANAIVPKSATPKNPTEPLD